MEGYFLVLFFVSFSACLCTNIKQSLYREGPNLFLNAEMEEPLDGKNNWYGENILVKRQAVPYSGLYSLKVSERASSTASLRQKVYVEVQGATYFMYAYVKVTKQLSGYPLGHKFSLAVQYQSNDVVERTTFATLPFVKWIDGWVRISGDFSLPPDVTEMTVFIFAPDDATVDFLVDSCSLQTLIPMANDLTLLQNKRIDQIRKGPLDVLLVTSQGLDPSKVRLEMRQLIHEFPFGVATEYFHFTGEQNDATKKYKKYLYRTFTHMTITNAAKWRFMESTEDEPYAQTIHDVISEVGRKGILVRGHCVAWGKEHKVPSWLRAKDNAHNIREAVSDRIRFIAQNYNETNIVHWDVNNENLHGTWYEENTGNLQITESMFTEMRYYDQDVKLFLNDYEVYSVGWYNAAYRRQALDMRRNAVPVSDIGVQAHFPDTEINPIELEKRLDVLSEAGVPIWLTELDVNEANEKKRADALETVMRHAFSHPNVEGIVLWSLWDKQQKFNKFLADGEEFVLNAAGMRVQNLIKTRWHSSAALTPSNHIQTFHQKVFYGEYALELYYDDHQIWERAISVSKDVSPEALVLTIKDNDGTLAVGFTSA